MFLASAYQAMQNTKTLFGLYVIENAVNIAAAVALYHVWGVEGLALAFSLAYLAGTAAALVELRSRLGGVDGARLLRSVTRIAAATLTMSAVVALIAARVGGDDGIGGLVRSGIGALAGVTVFLIAGHLLGLTELRELLRVGGGRRGGGR